MTRPKDICFHAKSHLSWNGKGGTRIGKSRGVFLAGSDRWQIKPLPGGTKPAGVPPPSCTPPPRCPDRGSGHGRAGLRRGLRATATGLASRSTVFTVQTRQEAPPHAALHYSRQLHHCNGNLGLPRQRQNGFPKVYEKPG